jgi:hypothetical protein
MKLSHTQNIYSQQAGLCMSHENEGIHITWGHQRGWNYFKNLSPVMPMEYKNLVPDAIS